MKKLKDEIIVYIHEEEDITYPVAVNSIDEIPDDMDGVEVGVYTLNKKYKFKVRRELK